MNDVVREQVLGILAEQGVPILDADAKRIVVPPPGHNASTVLFIGFGHLDDAPFIRIHAPVLLEVKTEGQARTKALDVVNRVNGIYPFGKLVYYEGDEKGGNIVYEHSLLADRLDGANFVRVVATVADTADTLDDVLLDELGEGKRFKDKSLEEQVADYDRPHEEADGSGRELAEGTFLRWIDQRPDNKPLGIVLSPVNEDMINVLMADHQGNTDLEVFVARREDTGVGASQLVQESLEIVEDGDPELMNFLRDLARDYPTP